MDTREPSKQAVSKLLEEAFAELCIVPKADRWDKWSKLSGDPAFFETVMDYVCCGGTIPELSKAWDIPYEWLTKFISSSGERQARYTSAMMARSEWATETVLSELRKTGTFDPTSVFNTDGTLKPVSEWPKDASAALSSIEVKQLYAKGDSEPIGDVTKVKFNDRKGSLELIGKHYGMFKEIKVLEGKLTLEKLLADA
jgi:hypothetical protein